MTETQKPASVAETLRAAKALIEDRKHWTQWAIARRADGRAVAGVDPSAQRWCMLGAIERVDGPFESQARATLRSVLPHGQYVDEFNDAVSRRHKQVLAKFDAAIAAAEQAAAS